MLFSFGGLLMFNVSSLVPFWASRWLFPLGAFVTSLGVVVDCWGVTGFEMLGSPWLVTIFSWLAALVIVYYKSVRKVKKDLTSPLLLYLCLFLFFSKKKVEFFIFFESMVLLVGLLMLMEGSNPERLGAFFYFMAYTLVGSFPLMVWIISHNSNVVFLGAATMEVSLLVCLVLPLIIKVPVYGLHSWLPKAHVEADVSGSVMLAGVLMKMGTFGLVVYGPCFKALYEKSGAIPLLVSGWIMYALFSSAFVTLRQFDLKLYVAYSSVFHMVTSGLLLMAPKGQTVSGFMYLSYGHGVIASSLFMFATYLYMKANTRKMQVASTTLSVRGAFLLLLAVKGSMPITVFAFGDFLVAKSLAKSALLICVVLMSMWTGVLGMFAWMSTSNKVEVEDYSLPVFIFVSVYVLLFTLMAPCVL